MVAGVQTQYVHLRRELAAAGIQFSVSEVRPWVSGGYLEKLPLPSRTKGTLRSAISIRRSLQRPADTVWSQVALPLLPHVLTKRWLRHAPVFFAIDCTPKLLYGLGEHYRSVSTNPDSVKGRIVNGAHRSFFKRCAGLLPWSQWAARSMIEDYGAIADKVRVLPPGVDTGRWKPGDPQANGGRRVRLLFVGGDYERKGGPLLLDVYRRHMREMCDLDMVTRADLPPEPGITVHTGYGPDDAGLLQLYQAADLLVVPTLADCFSMAAIEAMACGLPVVSCPIGGIPEIVLDGDTGILVPPGDGRRLLEALRGLVGSAETRLRLGAMGREVALRRFNASIQARLTVDLMVRWMEARAETEPSPGRVDA
jgi:glycosyltransferase involved in cell wall biosynthesis